MWQLQAQPTWPHSPTHQLPHLTCIAIIRITVAEQVISVHPILAGVLPLGRRRGRGTEQGQVWRGTVLVVDLYVLLKLTIWVKDMSLYMCISDDAFQIVMHYTRIVISMALKWKVYELNSTNSKYAKPNLQISCTLKQQMDHSRCTRSLLYPQGFSYNKHCFLIETPWPPQLIHPHLCPY